MKKILFFIILMAVGGICLSSFGDINLDLETYSAVKLSSFENTFNNVKPKISFETSLSENVYLKASLKALYMVGNEKIVYGNFDIFKLNIIYPLEISLEEAYVNFNNFIFEEVDFSLGKQRIFWGKADKVNPTDVLNPTDIFDVISFGEKIPTFYASLKYFFPFLENSGLHLAISPLSGQSRINSLVFNSIIAELNKRILEESPFPEKTTFYGQWEYHFESPDNNITNGVVGLRAFANILGFDLSLSFASRLNDFPYVKSVDISNKVEVEVTSIIPFKTKTNNIFVLHRKAYMAWYRENMIAFDFSKDLGFGVVWFETGVFLPEHTKSYSTNITHIEITGLITSNFYTNSYSEDTLYKDSYTKYVLGFERNFDYGWYLNIQFAHGLLFERGVNEESPQDYLIFSLEKTLLDDKFKLKVRTVLNTKDISQSIKSSRFLDDIIEHSGIMGQLEFSHSPVVGTEVGIGIIGIDARHQSILENIKEYDMVYLYFKTGI